VNLESWTEKAQQTTALLTAIVGAATVVCLPLWKWLSPALQRRREMRDVEKRSQVDLLVQQVATLTAEKRRAEEERDEEREQRLFLLTEQLELERQRTARLEALSQQAKSALQAVTTSPPSVRPPTGPRTPPCTTSSTSSPRPPPRATQKR
jgi:ABC-type bacteriocin/lantibiotic exporter with double-glycine peptidase domain